MTAPLKGHYRYRSALSRWVSGTQQSPIIVVPPSATTFARMFGGSLTSPGEVVAPPNNRDSLVYGTYKPDATTTGPNPGVVLTTIGTAPTYNGSGLCTNMGTSVDYLATSNNQVISGLEVWGRINLGSFTGVTIKDCIVHGTLVRGVDTAHIIAASDNLGGALIIDTKIAGRPVIVPATYTPVGGSATETLPNPGFVNNANEWCGGIRGGNYTIKRCEVTNVSDGLNNLYSCLVEGNWIHGAWFNEWDRANATGSGSSQANSRFYPYSPGVTNYTHCDGIQFSVKKNITVRGNMVGGKHVVGGHNLTPSEAPQVRTGDDFYNSCILIKQESTSNPANYLDYILVEKNWFHGAVCAINWPSDAYTGRTYPTVVFRSNRFIRATWASPLYILTPVSGGVPTLGDRTAGVSWPLTIPEPLVAVPGPVGWTGNVFDDNSAPVTISPGF